MKQLNIFCSVGRLRPSCRPVAAALLAGLLCLPASLFADDDLPLTPEQQLQQADPAELARLAREKGDPQRGAVLFHQPQAACTRCHSTGQGESPLGPDLAKLPEDVTPEHLVNSVLQPSKSIRKGYEPLIVVLDDGRTVTGLLVEERADAVVIRDVEQGGRPREIPRDRIDETVAGQQSIMPTGLANMIGGREEFLDLIAYLIEIAEHGPERAVALAPPPRAPDTSGSGPQVYRTMLPHAGPASLAIGLGGDVWACFDPQRGGVTYVWSGVLDLAPVHLQKINDPARVEGWLFYRDNMLRPLRTDHSERDTVAQFRGYRLTGDAVEVRYQIDDLDVRETLTRLADGPGLVREIELRGSGPHAWLKHDEQTACTVEVAPAVREADGWRIELNGTEPVSVRMTIRAQEEK